MAGLIVGGTVAATLAVAVPALAANHDGGSSAQAGPTTPTIAALTALANSSTSTISVTTTTTAAEPAPTTTVPAPTPEEQLEAKLAVMTPEERVAFNLYTATPEQRAAFSAYVVPPTTTTTAKPKPVVTTTTAAPAPAPEEEAPEAPEPEPAPVPTTAAPQQSAPGGFLACVRQRESKGNYSINTGNGYYGAYQFSQSTWNNTASHAGRGDLVGVRPSSASPADQDAMAVHLLNWYGRSPWAGPGC